jgi:hypothetical protein
LAELGEKESCDPDEDDESFSEGCSISSIADPAGYVLSEVA